MKYLDDLINEVEEVKNRFEESKELILCSGTNGRLEQIVNNALFLRYNSAINSIIDLERFMLDLKKCKSEEDKIGLIIRFKK